MGERVLCKHEVVGSIPSASTIWCGPSVLAIWCCLALIGLSALAGVP